MFLFINHKQLLSQRYGHFLGSCTYFVNCLHRTIITVYIFITGFENLCLFFWPEISHSFYKIFCQSQVLKSSLYFYLHVMSIFIFCLMLREEFSAAVRSSLQKLVQIGKSLKMTHTYLKHLF